MHRGDFLFWRGATRVLGAVDVRAEDLHHQKRQEIMKNIKDREKIVSLFQKKYCETVTVTEYFEKSTVKYSEYASNNAQY